MSIERTYHCEGPDCEVHGRSATPPPYLPWGFIETRETAPSGEVVHHFHSWGCAMKWAADQPIEEVVE